MLSMSLSPFFTAYVISWTTASFVALLLLVANRRRFVLFQRRYLLFLFRRWKIVTFGIAAAGLILIAPYTGDATWDYIDAGFMSVLTYLTAPWTAGILYRAIRGKGSYVEAYCAVCVWLFSSSWSYDLYLLLKYGAYPVTWLPNIFASSVLYAAAGLMWNVEWREGRGVIFGFMTDEWPRPGEGREFNKIVWLAIPIMALVAAMILPFLF